MRKEKIIPMWSQNEESCASLKVKNKKEHNKKKPNTVL